MMEKGLSNSNVRTQNRRKLTKLLYRQKGLTKQQIAFSMGLSLPTVNLLVSQLEEEGLLARQSSEVSSGGRIPDLLCFQYDARQVVGVEIQKDYCRILLVNLAGDIKAKQYVTAEFNDSYTYKRGLRARILQMLSENNISLENVIGVGVTLPGMIAPEDKTIEYPSILELKRSNFDKLDIELGFAVFVENEANAAAYAEVWNDQSIHDAVYLSVSENVSGALISNQSVLYGNNGRCGQFGHMTVVPHGNRCTCGRRGCLEAYCSTTVLSRYANGSLEDFFENLPQSIAFGKVWEDYLNILRIGISNLSIALDIPVILGGELREHIGPNIRELERGVANLMPFGAKRAPFRLSSMGADAAAVGVALMISARYLNINPEE